MICLDTQNICGIDFKVFFIIISREENLAKIARRVSDYKVNILSPPRPGKKLLVLDVDYTLFGLYYLNFSLI